MKVKRAILRGLAGGFVLFAMVTAASAAAVHIEGPEDVVVDENPATVETVEFEIFVDNSILTDVDFFGCTLAVSGLGIAFDYTATENLTDLVAADAGRPKKYIFQGDGGGAWAAQFSGGGPTSLEITDESDSGSGYNPNIQTSLGIFVIKITDETAALGVHTFSDLGDSFLGGATEDDNFTVPPFEFTVAPVPEPATISLLLLGALGMLARRKSR